MIIKTKENFILLRERLKTIEAVILKKIAQNEADFYMDFVSEHMNDFLENDSINLEIIKSL